MLDSFPDNIIYFRKPLWLSAAMLNFQQYDLSGDAKNSNFLVVHVKLGENWSICCRITAFLQITNGSRQPSSICNNAIPR
jgi:hypothetical protein